MRLSSSGQNCGWPMVSRSRMTLLLPVRVSTTMKRETLPVLTGIAHQRRRPTARWCPSPRRPCPFRAFRPRRNRPIGFRRKVAKVDTPGAGAGGEIDKASVRRRIDRPVGQIGPVGDLHQFAGRAVFIENLRRAGAMRNENQLGAGLVIGRHEEKRMMMNARVIGHLPHFPFRSRIGDDARARFCPAAFHRLTLNRFCARSIWARRPASASRS